MVAGRLQQVQIGYLVYRFSRYDPEANGVFAPGEAVARVLLGEVDVGGNHVSGVDKRPAWLLLAEDFENRHRSVLSVAQIPINDIICHEVTITPR
jgi:hypothetical protein